MFRPEAIRGVTVTQPGTVDYRLARQALVSEFRKKRLAQHEVCDAHPELVRAARECGEPTSIECPICEAANVVLVSYVFGPRLPAFGRCITSKDELTKLSRRADDLACYVVEVCPECSWNHLARAFPSGEAAAPEHRAATRPAPSSRPRRRRAAATCTSGPTGSASGTRRS